MGGTNTAKEPLQTQADYMNGCLDGAEFCTSIQNVYSNLIEINERNLWYN